VLLGAVIYCSLLPSAHAIEYTVQRRDYRFSTYFEVGADGAPIGTVLRERWRQPMRAHYVLYDADGGRQGEAVTRLWSLGLFFSWASTVDLLDRDGRPAYRLVGHFFTTETACFRLQSAEGKDLAMLHVDLARTGCVATLPDNPFAVLARYYRNQVSDYTHERWDFTTLPEGPVAPMAWQLIGAFLADLW
jgi:hypothetical protein